MQSVGPAASWKYCTAKKKYIRMDQKRKAARAPYKEIHTQN